MDPTPDTPPEIQPITPPPASTSKDERMWAMFCHLAGLIGGLVLVPSHLLFIVPVGNILGPLIIWMIKRDQYALVNDQGKEALNFQINVSIACAIGAVLCIVIIGIFVLWVVGMVALVLTIIASIKAYEGVAYRYPFIVRLIK